MRVKDELWEMDGEKRETVSKHMCVDDEKSPPKRLENKLWRPALETIHFVTLRSTAISPNNQY